ncbi:hypothetical protein LZ30DRAFT_743435 [Colletotrichum cereale]|nr:hypothetical protein LZ30DRAFT_743435 [Colletotrichum cereale]
MSQRQPQLTHKLGNHSPCQRQPACEPPPAAHFFGQAESLSVAPENSRHYLRSSPTTMTPQSTVSDTQQFLVSPDAIDIGSLLAHLEDPATAPFRHVRRAFPSSN